MKSATSYLCQLGVVTGMLLGACTSPPPGVERTSGALSLTPVTLVPLSVPFPLPVGIDHHEPTNKLLLTVNYPNGIPSNFALVAADGTRTAFSAVSGLTDELKVATVRSGPCTGGFAVGEAFSGNGEPGQVLRLSPDGSSVTNPWVTLPGETGLIRGSLFQDRYCVAGGDLIVVTTAGGAWRITAAGVATLLADVGEHLEGLSTIPNDPQYGPWAGKILAGAENTGRFYTFTPTAPATVTTFSIGINPEDIDIVLPNNNFYGVNYSAGRIVGAAAADFADKVGHIIVAQETPGHLWDVTWNASTNAFEKTLLGTVSQWEHVTFSTAGIKEIPPPDTDGDGVPDGADNCPSAANPGQEDGDGDGRGDACDACPADAANDADGDGVCGDVDNCAVVANATQTDADGDGKGDACDVCPADAADDADGDGVCGDVDNCPVVANATQSDADGDGKGDACDVCPADAADDADGDGVCGDVDNCAAVANATQADADRDGKGDVCDVCPADAANDADGDGVCGDVDICAGTVIPEAVPTTTLGVNRFALTNGDGIFDTTSPAGVGPRRQYTIQDTRGCSCEQIIVRDQLGEGHRKMGCSISAMDDFIASLRR